MVTQFEFVMESTKKSKGSKKQGPEMYKVIGSVSINHFFRESKAKYSPLALHS